MLNEQCSMHMDLFDTAIDLCRICCNKNAPGVAFTNTEAELSNNRLFTSATLSRLKARRCLWQLICNSIKYQGSRQPNDLTGTCSVM
jgi:hypothetical protein